jgi:hypothetical protein
MIREVGVTVLLELAVIQEESYPNRSLPKVIQSYLLALVLGKVVISKNLLVYIKPFDCGNTRENGILGRGCVGSRETIHYEISARGEFGAENVRVVPGVFGGDAFVRLS